jgi:hypothetical protein
VEFDEINFADLQLWWDWLRKATALIGVVRVVEIDQSMWQKAWIAIEMRSLI